VSWLNRCPIVQSSKCGSEAASDSVSEYFAVCCFVSLYVSLSLSLSLFLCFSLSCCCVTRTRANAINFVFNFQFVLALLPSRNNSITAAEIVGKFSRLELAWKLASKCSNITATAPSSSRAELQLPGPVWSRQRVPFDCGTITFNGARPIWLQLSSICTPL